MFRLKSDGGALTLLSQVLALSSSYEEIDDVQNVATDIGLNVDGALESAKSNIKFADKYVPLIKKAIMATI